MKKLLSLFLFCFIVFHASAQTKQADSTHKDTVQTVAIILTTNEYQSLINLLKEADEKPSIVNSWIQFLNSRIQVIQSNKEQPKKEK